MTRNQQITSKWTYSSLSPLTMNQLQGILLTPDRLAGELLGRQSSSRDMQVTDWEVLILKHSKNSNLLWEMRKSLQWPLWSIHGLSGTSCSHRAEVQKSCMSITMVEKVTVYSLMASRQQRGCTVQPKARKLGMLVSFHPSPLWQ